jgi:hypothetical protein
LTELSRMGRNSSDLKQGIPINNRVSDAFIRVAEIKWRPLSPGAPINEPRE